MVKNKIKSLLRTLTKHDYVEIVTRGNSAIDSAFSLISKNKKILIPEEGGWIHYKNGPPKLGLEIEEVRCNESKIILEDLKAKLPLAGALLYQNPGGYFAEQEMKEIYHLCNQNNCLVILDVSGSIGTELCDGDYADIIIGSFGKWKLVEARGGGFISTKDKSLFTQLKISSFEDETQLLKILQQLEELPERIRFLNNIRDKVINDLNNHNFEIVHPQDLGFVLVVKYKDEEEKNKLIKYCSDHELEFTECPRYIRLNDEAISIEIKRL